MCDCCDHPLEHAIRRALNAAENGVPTRQILNELRDSVEDWKEQK